MQKFVSRFWKWLPVAAVIVAIAVFALPAFATTYECAESQVFEWKSGVLEPSSRYQKGILRFNDETGDLWSAANASGPFTPTHFEIAQAMSPDNDLIASHTNVVDGHYVSGETLRIRTWDKTSGPVFLLTTDEGISSGKCKETGGAHGRADE